MTGYNFVKHEAPLKRWTKKLVEEIKRRHKKGETQVLLAKEFHTYQSVISRLINHKPSTKTDKTTEV